MIEVNNISAWVIPGFVKARQIKESDIVSVVCEYYSITEDKLKCKSRKREYVFARQICMYLIKENIVMSLVNIGNFLGGRDHTTVMYSIGEINKFLSINDEKVVTELQDLRMMITDFRIGANSISQ